jgi:hypothetical protein
MMTALILAAAMTKAEVMAFMDQASRAMQNCVIEIKYGNRGEHCDRYFRMTDDVDYYVQWGEENWYLFSQQDKQRMNRYVERINEAGAEIRIHNRYGR